MNKIKHIIILGGGQSAAYAAKEIRAIDTTSDLTIISDEASLPYERPPLSKDFLLNKLLVNQFLFFPESFYIENNINFIFNTTIKKIDFNNKRLISIDKVCFTYDKLLIATGSSNRKLNLNKKDIMPSENLIYLRNSKESQSIKEKIKESNSILIIGGGFIGLEIASSASQLNKNVTILERGNQLMGRVIPKEIAKLVQEKHEEHGTKIHLSVEIKEINKVNDSYEVVLNTKEKFLTNLLIIGVGSMPETAIFKESDLKIDNGIVTNEFSETSIPDVFAAGDVSNFYHPFYDMHVRLESFKHAQNHGINAGRNIVGLKTSYSEIPWMWSDQFNLNLQMTGLCNDYETTAQRGHDVKDGIIYFFLKNRRIVGACGLGIGGKIGRDIRLAGKLSEKKIIVNKEILSDKNKKLNKII